MLFRTLLKWQKNVKIYCDFKGYMNSSVFTRADNCPNMIVAQKESTIFVLELTVGFETNINLNTK